MLVVMARLRPLYCYHKLIEELSKVHKGSRLSEGAKGPRSISACLVRRVPLKVPQSPLSAQNRGFGD